MRLLLVEDDALLRQALQNDLETYHYQIDAVNSGDDAWEHLQAVGYDLVILDVNLPGMDGIDLCRRIRQHDLTMPVLLLTALDAPDHKVRGLDAGADDYMVKPYQFDELAARVRALLRRPAGGRSVLLTWGALHLDPSSQGVTYEGQPVSLSAKEYALLELFLRSPQRVVGMDTITDKLWAYEEVPSEGTVRTLIKRLRQKLKTASCADPLETIYGMGYRLKPCDTAPEDAESPRDRGSSPPAPDPPPLHPPPMRAAIQKLWQQFQPIQRQRLQVVAAAVETLGQGALTPEQQVAAQQAAHQLAGSLGSFNLAAGSVISRTLETRLQQASLLPAEAPSLSDLVTQLHSLLTTFPAHPSCESVPSLQTSLGPANSAPIRVPLASPPQSSRSHPSVEILDQDLFVEALGVYCQLAQQEGQSLGLLLLTMPQTLAPPGLDLAELAQILRSQIRQGDLLGSWDNSCIAIALYGIERDWAQKRLRQMLKHPACQHIGLTPATEITLGLALFPEDGSTVSALFKAVQHSPL